MSQWKNLDHFSVSVFIESVLEWFTQVIYFCVFSVTMTKKLRISSVDTKRIKLNLSSLSDRWISIIPKNLPNVVSVYLETTRRQRQHRMYLVDRHRIFSIVVLHFDSLVYSTPAANALSPYLNFDPTLLNSVNEVTTIDRIDLHWSFRVVHNSSYLRDKKNDVAD